MNNQELMTIGLKDYNKKINRPNAYFACLAAYNSGFLHGVRVDMTQDIDVIREEIADMLKRSPVTIEYGEIAEEWGIHDHEGFESIDVDRCNLEQLNEIAIALSESDYPNILADIYNDFYAGDTIESAKEYIEENDAGTYKDLGDFAESIYLECYDPIPKHLQWYIDWDRMGEDMEMNGEINSYNVGDGVKVLWNR